MTSTRTVGWLTIAALSCASPAFADEPAKAPEPAAALPAAPIAAPELNAFGDSKPLTSAELGEQRAAAKIEIDKVTINAPEQNGVVANNTAINTKTGDNAINGDAFSNASGFVSTIQNTGNNVLIQNSTIVNVSVAP